MCGRFTQIKSFEDYARIFRGELSDQDFSEQQPRYNAGPTQHLVVLRPLDKGERETMLMNWGWKRTFAGKDKLVFNARAETVAEKPMFLGAFQQGQRCLVPSEGFYEWKREGKSRIPWYITRKDRKPFLMAGLWEAKMQDGVMGFFFLVITTSANSLLQPLHDRMPVILKPEEYDTWLSPDSKAVDLQALLQPREWPDMERYPVSSRVNKVGEEGAELIDPLV